MFFSVPPCALMKISRKFGKLAATSSKSTHSPRCENIRRFRSFSSPRMQNPPPFSSSWTLKSSPSKGQRTLFSLEVSPFITSCHSEPFSVISSVPLACKTSCCKCVREISRLLPAQFSSSCVIIGVASKKSFKFSSQILLFIS